MREGGTRTFVGIPLAAALFGGHVLAEKAEPRKAAVIEGKLAVAQEKLAELSTQADQSSDAFYSKLTEVYRLVHEDVVAPTKEQLDEFYAQAISLQAPYHWVAGKYYGYGEETEMSSTLPGFFEKVADAQEQVFGKEFTNAPGGEKPLQVLYEKMIEDNGAQRAQEYIVNQIQIDLDSVEFLGDMLLLFTALAGFLAATGVVTMGWNRIRGNDY